MKRQAEESEESVVAAGEGNSGDNRVTDGLHKRKYTASDPTAINPAAIAESSKPTTSLANGVSAVADSKEKPKASKQRMAVLFGYCGSAYRGSQLNPGQPTVEKELMDACVRAGAITEQNNDAQRSGLNRCARTDKGVHAAGNVVSLKLFALPNLVDKINEQLPPTVRVFDAFQVTSSFNAKNHCGGRQYEYSLPTYFLKFAKRELYPFSALQSDNNYTSSNAKMVDSSLSWPLVGDSYRQLSEFRLPESQLQHLRDILRGYEGTHNFHNFTVGVTFKEKNAGRYITSFVACDPFVRADGVEWINLRVAGQSFMLHQIRKMVGLAVMMVRTGTSKDLVTLAYRQQKINIPKVP
ncbi:tRNA pseudouridine synthase 1, partial [Physocladia obscura]